MVEIDPQVTRAAFESFGLESDTPLGIVHLDARNRVDELYAAAVRGEYTDRFDLVYNDALNHYSPPFHLTTLEHVRKLRTLMSSDSVFLANTIDIFRSGQFLGAMINTVEQVFPYVYTFCTSPRGSSDEGERDTFMVVGSTRLLPVQDVGYLSYSAALLSSRDLALLRRRSRGLVLMDDFAPVDNLVTPFIRLVETRRGPEASSDAPALSPQDQRCRVRRCVGKSVRTCDVRGALRPVRVRRTARGTLAGPVRVHLQIGITGEDYAKRAAWRDSRPLDNSWSRRAIAWSNCSWRFNHRCAGRLNTLSNAVAARGEISALPLQMASISSIGRPVRSAMSAGDKP